MFKKYFSSLNANKKVFVFALCVAFFAQIFTGILACVSIFRCSQGVDAEADKLGQLAEDNAKIALQNQSKDVLLKTAAQISGSADLLLTPTESKVENLCSFAQNIYLSSSDGSSYAGNNQISGYVINNTENKENPGEVVIYENSSLPEDLAKEFNILSNISDTVSSIYKSSDEISGIYIATESGVVYKSNGESTSKIIDPRKSDWYKSAEETVRNGQKSGVWNAFNSDSDGGKRYIVFSKAFFDQNGRIKGVVAALLSSAKLCEKIGNFANYDDKHIFVFDNDVDKVISGYDESEAFFKGFDEPMESYDNLISSLKNRENTICDVMFGDEQYLIACSSLKKTNWSVGVAEKSLSVETGSKDIKDTLLGEIEISKKKSGANTSSIIFQFFIIFCSFGVVMYALCRAMAKKILPDMDSIQNDAKKFRKLSAELEMAEKIQKSMLPEASPSNLKRDDMEIYASSVSAEEVGGDFYDFFFIDDNRLALVIADTSDKGVPAALYMSAAKNLIKNKLKSTGYLALSLESVNDSLYEDNSMRMFVTAFVGIFNLKSGNFEFINAGHTPPLFYNHGKGSFDFLGGPHNCALGGIKGKKYAPGEITIYKDDVLLLYTDGVTETTNAESKLFSQEKLKELVNSENIKNLPIEDLIKTIRSEIKNYSGEGGYSDDITLLGFRNLTD